jgi:hypothetical protein
MTNIVLPLAINLASSWIYDKIKDGKNVKIRVSGLDVEVSKEKIADLLKKELREKPVMIKHIVSFSVPKVSKKELREAARTLSGKPIFFDNTQLPSPDNEVNFADYVSGRLRAILYIRDDALNVFFSKKLPLYAIAQSEMTPVYRQLIFVGLALSSKRLPSSSSIKIEQQFP